MFTKKTPLTFYYDSHCGLCLRFLKFVEKRDNSDLITAVPIEGTEYEDKQLAECGCLYSMIVIGEGKTYSHDQAVLQVLYRLSPFLGFWSTVSLIVPRPIRKYVYSFVSKNRKKIFKSE